MSVTVKFYAALREAIQDEVQLDFSADMNVQEFMYRLIDEYAGAGEIIKASRLAKNDAILVDTSVISDNDVIHVLPPSSGG